MKKIFYIFIFTILFSCNLYDRKEEVLLTDEDYVENYREFSPDSSMVLINYSLDLGAFGYGQAGTAVLKMTDTLNNIRNYTLPNTLSRVKWIDNQNISAKFDILPLLRSGDNIELKNEEINNIKIKVTALDYIEKDDHLEIEHKEISPNGNFQLVAYRYLKNSSNLNFIHVSIIPVGEQIPKYGNYLIADMQSDYVLFGNWTKTNEIEFYSNSNYADLIQYYLVNNRPKINYKVITDDKNYGSKYRWIKKSSI